MRANFDVIAPFYPILERLVFKARLDEARRSFFDVVLEANRVLLVGEGNGRFLKSLIARKLNGYIKVVEQSGLMIRLAKNRAGRSEKVALEFVEADLRRCQPGEGFDCVVTHFFLDLFNPPAQAAIIQKFAKLTTENATWINVDFIPARTLRGRLLLWLAYRFFRTISRIEAKSCSDESPAAAQSDWILAEAVRYLGGLVVARRYRKGPRNKIFANTANPGRQEGVEIPLDAIVSAKWK